MELSFICYVTKKNLQRDILIHICTLSHYNSSKSREERERRMALLQTSGCPLIRHYSKLRRFCPTYQGSRDTQILRRRQTSSGIEQKTRKSPSTLGDPDLRYLSLQTIRRTWNQSRSCSHRIIKNEA